MCPSSCFETNYVFSTHLTIWYQNPNFFSYVHYQFKCAIILLIVVIDASYKMNVPLFIWNTLYVNDAWFVEKLVETDAILTPMKAMQIELEAANKSDMRVHGMCNLELSVHGLLINIDTVVVDLNCQAILGMDILGDASKLPFILDLVDGTLFGGGYETIQLHRFHAATECFAETIDPVCIPPHSEVMLWAKLKTRQLGRPRSGSETNTTIFVIYIYWI